MSTPIITEQVLIESLDIHARSAALKREALVRYLTLKGIPFETTKTGKIWTVQRALDNAIIKNPETDDSETWDFDNGQKAS